MAIPRGTTPTFILTTTNQLVDWTLADHIYVAFYQERKRAGCHGNWNNRVTKTEEDVDIDKQSIAVYLDDENAVVRMFVILDRRVGKCTLVKLASNIDSQPEWLQKF